MEVVATISFCGGITMRKGEKRELLKGKALDSLLACGYVKPVRAEADTDRTEAQRAADEAKEKAAAEKKTQKARKEAKAK